MNVPNAAPPVAVQESGPSVITRAAWAILYPARLALRPLGWAFRIREPLSAPWRIVLPCVLLAAVIVAWDRATKGDHALASFPSLSQLDEREAEIAAAAGYAPAQVSFTVRKVKKASWSSNEEKSYAEILEVALPDRDRLATRKSAIDDVLGTGQFDMVVGDPAQDGKPGIASWKGVKLVAKSHFGIAECDSEWTKARDRLLAANLNPYVLEGVVESSRNSSRVVTVLIEARQEGAAAVSTGAISVLDDLIGPGSYEVEGNVVRGKERLETRFVSPALLPSPKEMLAALPSLLNSRWKDWDDARHWWAVGDPEKGAAPRAPKPLDWSRPNDVPFELAARGLARALGPRWPDWTLLQAVVWSTIRIVLGFLYAALVAVPLGVTMGSFSKPRFLFEPVRLLGSYLPLPAFLSLTIFWWGTTESQKIGFLAICTFVVLLPQVVMAVEAVPQAHVDLARTLGANRWHQMRHVLVAGAKADIARALRLSFAVGWTWIILAEMINPLAGLGYVIQLGERRTEHRPHIYAVVLLIVALAFAVNGAWARVEQRLFPYRDAEVS